MAVEIRELIDVRLAINKYVTEMAKILPADPEETEQILDRIAGLVPNFGFDRDKIRSFVLGITLPKQEPCNAIASAPAPTFEEEEDEMIEEIAEEDETETVEEVVEEAIETPSTPTPPKKKSGEKRAYNLLSNEELLHLMEYIPEVDGLYHTDACEVICKRCPTVSKKTIARILNKTTFRNKTDEFFELRDGIVLSNKKKK